MKTLVYKTVLLGLMLAVTGFASQPSSVHAFPVQHDVSGTVTDASNGEPMPGVNVVVKGTLIGTATDHNGRYALQAPAPTDSLTFSFVGYETQTIAIEGRSQIDVALRPDVTMGDELVVVGYSEMRRETLTGAISTVSGRELESAPVTNLSNTLAGRLPGLVIVHTSGEPGRDDALMRIRGEHTLGNNQPLVVIDGVPNRAGGLDRLNPRDIQSITVLKDASAAIYGSQAANGVILVTTKRGEEGAPQVRLDVNQGFNQPTRLPEMADAPTYMRMLNEVNLYRNLPARYSEEVIQMHADPTADPWLYPSTNWFAEAIKPISYQTKANASVSGGGGGLRYYASLSGLTEDGILRNTSTQYNQLGLRSNLNGQLTDNVSLRLDVAGRLEERNYPTVSTNSTFEKLIRGKPNEPGFWPSGHPGPAIEAGENPVITGTDVTGYDNDERYYLQTNLQLSANIPALDGLSVRGSAAFDRHFRQGKRWVTPWMLYEFDRDAYRNAGGDPVQYLSGSLRGIVAPELTRQSIDGADLLLSLVGEYRKDLTDHSYVMLLGTERQTWRNDFFSAFRTNFMSESIDQLFAGGTLQQDINGSASSGARLNFFSRLNYAYQSKYLIEFIGRYDGSYIFPRGKRFGFFPAASIGWRLTQEDWFRNTVGLFDELKLRTSWGRTGNDRVDPYQFLIGYGVGPIYVFDIDKEAVSLIPTRTPNQNITWEVATQFDVGIEGQILNRRLSFELDYFSNLREGILTPRNAEVPRSTGLVLPDENIGEVESWGFDGSVTWFQPVRNDFFFDVTLTGGYATNRIRFWDEPPGAPEWQRSTGAKMRTGLYYEAIGVFRTQEDVDNHPSWPGARPGDIIFRDVNGDGVIDANDRVRINRNNIPDWMGGLTINSQFRQFDISVFFQGAAGASQYVRTASGEFGNYYKDFAENRWTPENPNDHTPRAFSRTEEYWMAQDNTYFFYKTDYVRLKTLELGYTLPASMNTRLGVDNMRIYANGFNLLTWDTYKLGDPEAASLQRGGAYPQRRIFNLGIALGF